jgi:hypothetical protein
MEQGSVLGHLLPRDANGRMTHAHLELRAKANTTGFFHTRSLVRSELAQPKLSYCGEQFEGPGLWGHSELVSSPPTNLPSVEPIGWESKNSCN